MVNSQTNNLSARVEQQLPLFLEKFSDPVSFEIGFSGGIDSAVLLDIMYVLSQKYSFVVTAVHVHHGLQKVADDWVDFCAQICSKYEIPLRVEKVYVDTQSPLGIEAQARQCRYRVLQNSKQSVVALAHHRDDQIETFLLAMLRGGGLRGMVAMPPIRSLGADLLLWRPLLSVSKLEIIQYANTHALKYIQDYSNMDNDHTRNWVRNRLLPCVKNKIKCADKHIVKNIRSLQNVLLIVDELVEKDYAYCSVDEVILVERLRLLSQDRAKEVLMYFLKQHHLGTPRQNSINSFTNWLFGPSSQTYEWQVPHGCIYVCYGKIWAWANHHPLRQKLGSTYFTSSDITWIANIKGIHQDFVTQRWSIRRVNKKDTIRTEIGLQSVFNLLKKHKIPRFIRGYWPVIVNQHDICIIVVGLRVDCDYQHNHGLVPYIQHLAIFLKVKSIASVVSIPIKSNGH